MGEPTQWDMMSDKEREEAFTDVIIQNKQFKHRIEELEEKLENVDILNNLPFNDDILESVKDWVHFCDNKTGTNTNEKLCRYQDCVTACDLCKLLNPVIELYEKALRSCVEAFDTACQNCTLEIIPGEYSPCDNCNIETAKKQAEPFVKKDENNGK